MAKLLLVDVVKPIFLGLRKKDMGEDSIRKIFEEADRHCAGIKQVFQDLLVEERNGAFPWIKALAEELDTIFRPYNTEVCSVCKAHERHKVEDRNIGCCSQCWVNHGHFNFSTDFVAARRELGKLMDTYGWDHVYGFLGKDGCMLPRESRSNTCLNHMCDEFQKALTPGQRKRVEDIVYKIRKLRDTINSPLM